MLDSVRGGTAYVTGTGSLNNPELTTWATQCTSKDEIASVRAKCAAWEGRSKDFDAAWVDTCVKDYCRMVNVKADCGENCDAVKLPTTKDMCTGGSCAHYRLGWRLGATWNIVTPKLIRLTGSKAQTKWMILPHLQFHNNHDYSPWEGPEYQEVDLWIDDLGDISNGTLYLDDSGKFSAVKNFAHFFIPDFVLVAKIGSESVTHIGFRNAPHGPQFCKDGPSQCNEVSPATVTTSRKWYDLVNPKPVCKDRGLCPFHDDFGGYGNSIPSWRERKEMTMTNAVRSEPVQWFSRYHDKSEAEVKSFLDGCKAPFEAPEFAPPYYYHVGATEGARLKAWDLGHVCDEPRSPHFTCNKTVRDLHLTDDRHTTRVAAHTSQPCVHPFECNNIPSSRTLTTPRFITESTNLLAEAGAAEGIGSVPFFGSCGHYHGMMDPKRNMAAIGTFPQKDWSVKNPTERYTAHVFLYLTHNPYNHPGFLTYQPISTGTHFTVDQKAGEKIVRFMTHYYDRSGETPEAVEVVINGKPSRMSRTLGVASRGTYEVDLPFPGDGASCMSYFFRTRNSKGSFTLPQSGEFVYQTYGVGTCLEDFAESTCSGADCRSTCGFPGTPCSHHDKTPSPSGGNVVAGCSSMDTEETCVAAEEGGAKFRPCAWCCGLNCPGTNAKCAPAESLAQNVERKENGSDTCPRYGLGIVGSTCPNDEGVIRSKVECEHALRTLGKLKINTWFEGSLSEIPAGCSVRDGGDEVPHINDLAGVGNGRADLQPICRVPRFRLEGTGVAGGVEIWNVDTANGLGVESCFQAVLKDKRCIGGYFTYVARSDQNCGCKGDAGALVVRPDRNSDHYRYGGDAADLLTPTAPAGGKPAVPSASPSPAKGFKLEGLGVAGGVEVWNVDRANGLGVESCFQAVLKDTRCIGGYFTYVARSDQNCGCKGDTGALAVRPDTNSDHYRYGDLLELSAPVSPPAGSTQGFRLVGTGVAGGVEIWSVDRAKGLGVESCFKAVLGDSRCIGGYFTYAARGDKNCGCKGDNGALAVRPDRGSDHYHYGVELGGTNDENARNLVACIGECDSDDQCKPGLKCFQRTGFNDVPGCRGKGKEDWDYCYDPTGSIELGGPNNDNASNLQACKGECDSDAQCASGLKCFQRDDGETIPGCIGAGGGADWDYCYDPNWQAQGATQRRLEMIPPIKVEPSMNTHVRG